MKKRALADSLLNRRDGRRLRIAIATLGRFHVLDLARELSNLGHEVRFYSYVPRRRAERFGLPRGCHVGLLPFLFPLVVLARLLPRSLHRWVERWMYYAANLAVIARLQPCDVLICMSGVYLEAPRYARRKYGALVFLERGSRHILSQHNILSSIRNSEFPSVFAIQRELQGYDIADRIVVPSIQTERSFIERGIRKEKLFRNPYGVDWQMFRPTPAPVRVPLTMLYVGAWSFRKGVDVLVQAAMQFRDVRLVHVGPIGDATFPDDPRFVHYPPVPQWRLSEYYANAHFFVLASREEGLSLVLVQALASGLPLVCTNMTGGEDLRSYVVDPSLVCIVRAGDVAELEGGIRMMIPKASALSGNRNLLSDAGRDFLTWRAYGGRYERELVSSVEINRL